MPEVSPTYPADSAVTWLFVPGDRPERFATAQAAGADAIILDLEDAVAADAKERAREHVVSWLAQGPVRGWVRINAAGTPWYDDDVAAVGGLAGLTGIVAPKAEDPAQLAELRGRLRPGAGVVALVESARGLHRSLELAGQADRLAFGSIDFAADIGAEHTGESLLLARGTLVLSSRLAGIAAPVDGVTTALRDPQALAADVAAARRLGFTGKLCIHPAQVAPAAAGFAPSPAEVAWARRVVAAGDAGPGAVSVDGAMVDKPVLERARRILGRTQ